MDIVATIVESHAKMIRSASGNRGFAITNIRMLQVEQFLVRFQLMNLCKPYLTFLIISTACPHGAYPKHECPTPFTCGGEVTPCSSPPSCLDPNFDITACARVIGLENKGICVSDTECSSAALCNSNSDCAKGTVCTISCCDIGLPGGHCFPVCGSYSP